jgi:ABC-type lipopolysaccharide export system ATPase subunit
MNFSESVCIKSLTQDQQFRNLTVEQAIRLLGEKEKEVINTEREKLVNELKEKLEEKSSQMRR